jgi:hypothetical protein
MLRNSAFALIAIFITGIVITGCGNNGNSGKTDKDSVKAEPKVSVYYLHQTKGCKTCKAIAKLSKATTAGHFQKEMKAGTLAYYDLDITRPANDSIANKFECAWAGLYILSSANGKEVTEDLTDVAFMYAIEKPDSLEQIIISAITKKL